MVLQDKIEKAIKLGKIKGAKVLLTEYYNNEHKNEWLTTKREEYDALFPEIEYKYIPYDESSAWEDGEIDGYIYDHLQYPNDKIDYIAYQYSRKIDYSEDETYVTYTDWLNETIVVSEAVEEVSHIEEVDGFEVKVIDVEAKPEVTELVRPYTPMSVDEVEVKVSEYTRTNYRMFREAAYPLIEEQLDMQYKDALDGGTRFKDAIEAIKSMYPKGE